MSAFLRFFSFACFAPLSIEPKPAKQGCKAGVVSIQRLKTPQQRRYNAEKRCYNTVQRRRGVVEALYEKNNASTTLLQHFYNAFTSLLKRFYNASTTLLQRFYSASKAKKKTLLQRFCSVAEASQRRCCGVVAAFLGVVINIRWDNSLQNKRRNTLLQRRNTLLQRRCDAAEAL